MYNDSLTDSEIKSLVFDILYTQDLSEIKKCLNDRGIGSDVVSKYINQILYDIQTYCESFDVEINALQSRINALQAEKQDWAQRAAWIDDFKGNSN